MEPIDPNQPPKKKISFFQSLMEGPMTRNKILLLAGLLLVAILILGVSFWFGFRGNKATPETSEETTTELSPTPIESITETPVDEPTPSESPTPTKKPSPTPTKSPTPTLTSTPTLTPTQTTQTTTITATASLDGFQSNNGGGNTTDDIRMGRNANLITRGFVSFSLASLPSGAIIEQATLKLYQSSIDGSPYSVGGNVKIDHLAYGDTLDNSDYSSASFSTSFATLSISPLIEWKEADATDRLRDDMQNHRTTSQYRLHFEIETVGGDVTGDFVHFSAAESGSDNAPRLVVRYH